MKNNIIKGLILTTIIGGIFISTELKDNTFVSASNTTIQYNVEQPIANVLVYNSHSCEDYRGESISEGTKDFCKKLNNKNINVTFLSDKFSDLQGYDKSYHSSRARLENMDLSKYDLIIDYHRDSRSKYTYTTNKCGNKTAKVFAVLSRNYNKAFNKNNNLINSLKAFTDDKFGENIWEDTYYYNNGISHGFNQDITNNNILLEVGDNQNNLNEIKACNTEIVYALENYFKNN